MRKRKGGGTRRATKGGTPKGVTKEQPTHGMRHHAIHVITAAFRCLADWLVGALLFVALLKIGEWVGAQTSHIDAVKEPIFAATVEYTEAAVKAVDFVLYLWFVVTSAIRAGKEFIR